MDTFKQLCNAVAEGAYDSCFRALYVPEGDPVRLKRARDRATGVLEAFQHSFAPGEETPAALFSGPGRTEIGGNHTDHQRGRVLCGSVDMDLLACAAPNSAGRIRVISEGYPALELAPDELAPRTGEQGSSLALLRGVAAGVAEAGYPLRGLDIYAVSDVLSGSGLSSSAAYEILIGNVLNAFCCGGALDAIALAKIGQRAENVFFGKPCGLMDQMGSSVGGAVAIDFADPADPKVEKVDYDFSRSGHALCIVDTGSEHADLTADYAAIPAEMGEIAGYFGKLVLREVPEADFRAALPALRQRCGDRAVLRALHFFRENRRAVEEAEALRRGDFSAFLALVNASGLSSELWLQNGWSLSAPRSQAVTLSLALGRELLEGRGAIRIHGGGFAGTIQAFVPKDLLEPFRQGMEAVLGAGRCHVLHIRPAGGCRLEKA